MIDSTLGDRRCATSDTLPCNVPALVVLWSGTEIKLAGGPS